MSTRQPFENLKYRIHNIPKSADLYEEFPDLQKHKYELTHKEGEVEVTQHNELLRYLIYMYDPKSDLIRQEPELAERRKKAKELSGLYPNSDNDVLAGLGLYFLTRIIFDRKFREWNTLQQELEENNRARWTPIDQNEGNQKNLMEAYQKKGLLRTQGMEIQKTLDAIESEIFGDNSDVLKKANEIMLTTPEKIAAAYV